VRACDVQHRFVEIGCDKARVGGKMVAQGAGRDAGAGGGLQHLAWLAGGGAARDIGGIVDENDRAEIAVVMLRDAADEGRGFTAQDRLHSISGRLQRAG
jgi:hypothetical protein